MRKRLNPESRHASKRPKPEIPETMTSELFQYNPGIKIAKKQLRVLVACESSGTVREAFRGLGHDAWSCDLQTADDSSNFHFQGDCLDVFSAGWDLIIAHPPCTYLTVSANKWLKDQPERLSGALVGEARREARREAIAFFLAMMNAPAPMICVENPIGCMSSIFRKPDQVIQPWQFGHGETKATCLWLKGLQRLRPTEISEQREQRMHKLPPSADRWKLRSVTYSGIANAMASQWAGKFESKLKP